MAFAREHGGLQDILLRHRRRQREMPGHLELAARQRSCLVRADHRRRPEGLHAGEPPDEHAARRQPPGPCGQKEGQDDGKLFGDRGHRQADGAEQRPGPGLAACEAQPEQRDRHDDGDDTEAPDEDARLLLQRTG